MTATNGASATPSGATGGGGDELCEELCDMQAELLGLGADNYQRLLRVCPDPNLRLHALLHRVANRRRPPTPVRPPGQPRCDGARSHPSTSGAVRSESHAPRWSGTNGHASAFDLDEAWDAAEHFTAVPHRDAHRCWRCDARRAADEIGLCEPCHGSLVDA